MLKLDVSQATANAYFDELRATAEIRQAYNEIIVLNANALYGDFKHDVKLKGRLSEALALKGTDQSALLTGLFIQAVGVFEEFIRSLVADVVKIRAASSLKYSELNESLRNSFISHSGKVLAYYGSGSVNGVRYDFSRLTSSLALCLADRENYYLEPRVFTILMGSCTPERLEKLFSVVDLPEPFCPELGECTLLKQAMGETRKAVVAELAKKRLKELIGLRNNIAHGDLTVSISIDEFRLNVETLSALTNAFKKLCEGQA